MISKDELARIVIHARRSDIDKYYEPLVAAMAEFDIDNLMRVCAFIAQIAHESGSFRYVRELASGDAYEKRTDLGNTPLDDGDGPRYKGRGLLQITGADNVRDCSTALFGDPDLLLYYPERLEEPEIACRSAAWFWKNRGLNELADHGDFKLITKRINGGYNGWKDRYEHYERAKEVLS